MRVYVKDDRIRCEVPYGTQEVMKSIPGYRWDAAAKEWTYPATPAAAEPVGAVIDPEGWSEGFRALHARAAALAGMQEIKRSDELPDIPGKTEAWIEQRRAFHFVVESGLQGAMLAMDMGTGKTRTAIGLLEHWNAHRVVILAPKNVVAVWPDQFEQHSSVSWHVIVPPKSATVAKRAVYVSKQIALAEARGQRWAVVLNYEAFWRPAMMGVLKAMELDVLLADESHRIKAPGGSAAKGAHVLSRRARRRLCLTGTPMPHSPMDIYSQYRMLDESVYGTSFSRFRARYAIMGGFEGRQVVDYQNEPDLKRKFHSIAFECKAPDTNPVHMRRKFELSPKARRAYDAVKADFDIMANDGTVTIQNALTKLIRLQQITSGFIRDDEGVDQHLADDKVELLMDVMEDIPREEPVVIFCRFHEDIDRITMRLRAEGYRVGELSGRSTTALDGPRMAEDIDVAVIQEQAGGVGIDLTRSCYCIWYSLSFSLGDFLQALKRQDRPGQTQRVKYIYLIAQGTKDEDVLAALEARHEVVEAVIRASKGGS